MHGQVSAQGTDKVKEHMVGRVKGAVVVGCFLSGGWMQQSTGFSLAMYESLFKANSTDGTCNILMWEHQGCAC
jgi:hypothetical protein